MTSDLIAEERERGRSRVRQIFRFLKDFNELRNPVKRQIGEQPWVMWLRDVPQHFCVSVRGRSGSREADEALLRVRRPDIPPPPVPPKLLIGWLPETWRDPSVKVVEPIPERETRQADGSTGAESFDASADRVTAFGQWSTERAAWAPAALLAREVLHVFNRLYELHGRREREGEAIQLLLGQGTLLWRRDDGDVRHPIVTQRLELQFDPNIPEFTLSETDQPAELLRSLLFTDHGAAAQTIQTADEDLAKADSDLLDSAQIEGPLRRLAAVLHAEGRFVSDIPLQAMPFPQIFCDPVIYLSRRNQGFSAALDHVLEDLAQSTSLPSSLLRISGIETAVGDVTPDAQRAPWEEPAEILFTKEANEEQIQIADRLGRHGNVLVQGPPGTGKTHTIANLIGHLLAQGKRILVTAHTSKALKVVREKVVEPLQTLCVSVLDNETESRKQLEASVDAMVARLSSEDPRELDKRASIAERERQRLVSELSEVRRALVDARRDEYRDVVLSGVSTSPSEAARFVAERAAENSWIPCPIDPGVPAPLSDEEVAQLYLTNQSVCPEDESELRRWMPAPGQIPGAVEFGREAQTWRTLVESDTTTGAAYWSDSLHESSEEELLGIHARIQSSVQLLTDAPGWKLDAIAAGMSERADAVAPWTELTTRIADLRDKAERFVGLLLDHRCILASYISPHQNGSIANEIREFLESGRKLTTMRLLSKPTWRKFLSAVKVNDGEPRSTIAFAAIEAHAELTSDREKLAIRWTNQISRRGGPRWEDFGSKPEEGTAVLTPQVRALLDWQHTDLSPLIAELKAAGFKWAEFIEAQEIVPGEHVELRRLVDSVVGPLGPIVAARTNCVNMGSLERKFQQWRRQLFSPERDLLPASAVLDLRSAFDRKNQEEYDKAYRRLVALHELRQDFDRRRLLLGRLRLNAIRWASDIEAREGSHGAGTPPGLVSAAWKWHQFLIELEKRGGVSIPALQMRISEILTQLRAVTAQLIELRSWSAQCKRVGLEEKQALQGWKDIVRRIGRGTGQRAPGLRVEARKTLASARNAVPVWIMPLARVAETFDPRVTHFDVVIVDESSQCDVMGLLALYLADQTLVVGDHEQVSPLAVGQELTEVERLIEQHLNGIPNSKLYDGRMSLYDLARQSFGGVIRLLEHFRCIPEIIAFSNDISYKREIKPLRDPTGSLLVPAVVPYRVDGTRGSGKVNREEARSIVSLLWAAIDQPEYRGKTFGVVSLLGEEQAVEIEKLARQKLHPAQLEACKFLCGTAAQFQGDERDVVFLSLVDSPADGPLRKTDLELYRQRFNVAASRPKDQLWVVHSLDPRRDLQSGDLRRRLIEHAEAPRSLLNQQTAAEAHTESEFERQVLRRLVDAGFRVTPQWAVGRYRIDLVVEGTNRRLAVECDGDRYHPLEKIAEDMARQAVLERLKWRFVRIRGSLFFRDPTAAMEPVFEELNRLQILPHVGPRVVESMESGLLDRVKRRSSEILREWDQDTILASATTHDASHEAPAPG